MLPLNNKIELMDLMAQGVNLITPNNRLSAALLDDYFKYANKRSVDKPSCLPYKASIAHAFQKYLFLNQYEDQPTLISESQSLQIWRTLIKSEPSITYSEGLLKAIKQCYEHVTQWQIDPFSDEFKHTPQTAQFQKWWQLYNQRLKDLNLINEHQIIHYMVASDYPLYSDTVVWVCFDEFTPEQLLIQKHLLEHKVSQYHYDLAPNHAKTCQFVAEDHAEEVKQLIAWLQVQIEQGSHRIGVVVPDLQQESRTFQRTLERHVNPSLFNISLGQPINDYPLVAHALTWLSLNTQDITHEQAILVLQSPYITWGEEEFLPRQQYLQDSSLLNNQSIPFKTFLNSLRSYSPKLAECLGCITPYPKIATIQEWIQHFQNRLNTLGFPGEMGLNSEQYQCLSRFINLFDEFRQLSLINPEFQAQEALQAFKALANNTIFQAQKPNAPIQILGLLEASGCEYDSLWVMGLTDQCLPQKVQLSPFIPPSLQRALKMPHSCPDREFDFARKTLQRLQSGSSSCVMSYAKLKGDSPNLPCTLITELPVYEPISIDMNSISTQELIEIKQTYSLPLKPGEQYSGGTALLANQAKCPFKAFAEHRLAAKPIQETVDGLDFRERGTLIHKVMEQLWKALGSQNTLLNLSTQALDHQMDNAIISALTPLKERHPDTFIDLMMEIEHTRLKHMMLSCLEWEKQRPPFEVEVVEHSFTITLSDLEFKVRVDRLDNVAGKKWIIDYKSTLPTNKPWNEERPKEPQLLLYALLDEDINALLLVQLQAGHILCSGLSEEKQNILGISCLKNGESWDECRTRWHKQLTELAREFQEGHYPPNPANPGICQQCDFQNLCRYQAG